MIACFVVCWGWGLGGWRGRECGKAFGNATERVTNRDWGLGEKDLRIREEEETERRGLRDP